MSNKASLDIESKIAYPFPEFKNKFLVFIKQIRNRNSPQSSGVYRASMETRSSSLTGSIRMKVIMNIVLNSLSSFYQNQLLTTMAFGLVMQIMAVMPYMSSNHAKKMQTKRIENVIPSILTSQQYMTTSILSLLIQCNCLQRLTLPNA